MNKRQKRKQAKKIRIVKNAEKPLREGKEIGAMKLGPRSPEPQTTPPPQDSR